jgi:hypothetical protein
MAHAERHAEQPTSPRRASARGRPPFEVEDLTDPEMVQELMQAHMLAMWIASERAQGRKPN